jgi:hypothetical protein
MIAAIGAIGGEVLTTTVSTLRLVDARAIACPTNDNPPRILTAIELFPKWDSGRRRIVTPFLVSDAA